MIFCGNKRQHSDKRNMVGKVMIDIDSYKRFMQIDSFPEFVIQYFAVDLDQGYVKVAKAEYDFQSQKHKLLVPSNIDYHKFWLYHELTHIVDADNYYNGDTAHDYLLTGYMEYHASQVELMLLLGAETIKDRITFSVNDSVNYLDWTICQFVNEKFNAASKLINSSNKQDRICGTGVLFNYLGLRSICNMFATDYTDNRDYSDIVAHMSFFLWDDIRKYMTGWIDDIENIVALYSNVYCELV